MITVKGVSHRYPGASQPALDQLDLSINAGELFGLLGPNGAGKTTLISLLTGLRKLSHGSIHYDDLDIVAERRAILSKLAWVPQEYAFYPAMTVRENLTFFARAQRIDPAKEAARIDKAVYITGLEQTGQKRAAQFSGGLKRRLNVAISLLGEPEYLFLDEPTVGIDPQSRHFILNAIRDINAAGTTIIYSSHYMEEVEFLCDRIAIIDHGKLRKLGSVAQLLAAEQSDHASLVLQNSLPDSIVVPDVIKVSADGLTLSVAIAKQQALLDFMQQLNEQNIQVNRFDRGSASLEQLFLSLTHRSLRD